MHSLLARLQGAAFMRRTISLADPADCAFTAGCALVAIGAAMVFLPAGVIVGGALLAWIGWRAGT